MNTPKRARRQSGPTGVFAKLRGDDRLQALAGLAIAAVVVVLGAPYFSESLADFGAMLGAPPQR